MRAGYRILDTERHVLEPADLWQKRLPSGLRHRAPQVSPDRRTIAVDGRPMMTDGEILAGLGPIDGAGAETPAGNLADMDREGIDAAILFPTVGLYATWSDELPADLSVALCRTYNDWLADYCAADAHRLKGLALLPLQDVPAAVAELKRARSELGLVGAVLRPNPLLRRQLFHTDYFPLYAEAERLGTPLCIHGGPGSVLPELGVKDFTGAEHPNGVQRFTGLLPRNAISYPLEVMGAMISLAGEEPLMEFPGLRVLFASAGAGWLHWWVERMDDEFMHLGYDAVTKLKPGHYVKRQAAVAAYADEGILPFLLDEFGDNLTWGSAYPSPYLTRFPDELAPLLENPEIPDAARRKILWDTPARLFGLEQD